MFTKEIQAISTHHQKGMSHVLPGRYCGSQPGGRTYSLLQLCHPPVLLVDGEAGLKNLVGFIVRVLHRYLSLQGRLWICREMMPFVVIQISSLIAITC